MQTLHTHSESETIKAAQTYAKTLDKHAIVLMSGTLGAGKSVFARALIRTRIKDETLNVPSPTFTLVQNYEAPDGTIINHYDLYRLEDPEEIYELGWEDSLTEGITLVEWPERLGALAPINAHKITITVDADDKNTRIITIKDEKTAQ